MSLSLAQRQLAAVAAVVVVADVLTKQVALAMLPPPGLTERVFGEYVRLSLAFNRGAAFGMSVGPWSRVLFSVFALVMVGGLWVYAGRLFAPLTRLVIAFGLVSGGAIGNLIDRVRWDRGVVDFIDVGVGLTRFWTFNLADSAITIGAILLLWPTPPAKPADPAAASRARGS